MAQWGYSGLKNMKVNSLEIHNNYIFAATDNGLFRKDILTTDTIWNLIGFQNQQVNDIYIRDTNYLYAGVQCTGIGADTISLFITHNGGAIWNTLWGAYDSSQLSYVQIGDIDGVRNNSDTIIIMSGGIRKSVDGGVSFTKVNYQGGRFLAIAPDNSNIMWTGGEGVLLNPYLIQSTDEGDTWNFNDSLHQIIPGDNTCLCADIHPVNSNIVYVGMEGQIGKSINNGSNWIKFLIPPYYVKAVKISPTNPLVVYATGGSFGGKSVVLFVSNNEGASWDTLKIHLGTIMNVDALELTVKEHNGTDLIFIGTRINGIYRYENIVDNIYDMPTPGKSGFRIYPNPLNDYTTLEFYNPQKEIHILKLYNTQGQLVRTISNITTKKIRIERKNLAAGLYFYQLLKESEIHYSGKLLIR